MRAIALAVLLALALPCAPIRADDPPAPRVPKAAEEAIAAALPFLQEAQRALTARQWTAAVEAYARELEALGAEPVLGGWRAEARYNQACAYARMGHAAEAAATFAKCIEKGLEPVLTQDAAGDWVERPGLTLEHVLADSDLDTIRNEKAYLDALKPYLAAGEPTIEFTRPDTNSLVPAVIVLAAVGEEAERGLPAWRVAAKEKGLRIALVAVEGPVCATPNERAWLLRDGDERWAVAKIGEAVDLAAKDVRVDAKRIFVVGVGERPGEAAWAAAMTDSARLAGFAAPGARFHAAWHADAIARLPKTWRVALGAADETAAKLLAPVGIEAVRVETTNDQAKAAGAILDALVGKP